MFVSFGSCSRSRPCSGLWWIGVIERSPIVECPVLLDHLDFNKAHFGPSVGKCIADFQGRVIGNRPETSYQSHRLMLVPFAPGRFFQAEAILQDKHQELGPQGEWVEERTACCSILVVILWCSPRAMLRCEGLARKLAVTEAVSRDAKRRLEDLPASQSMILSVMYSW